MLRKVQDDGVEVNLLPRTFSSDLQQIMPKSEKWLSLLSNGEKKTDFIYLFLNFLKKYEKNVSIIINDEKHTWRVEDGVSPLQLFFCNHLEVDSRIAPHTSKSSRKVVIVAKSTDFLMLLIYSYSTREISK